MSVFRSLNQAGSRRRGLTRDLELAVEQIDLEQLTCHARALVCDDDGAHTG